MYSTHSTYSGCIRVRVVMLLLLLLVFVCSAKLSGVYVVRASRGDEVTYTRTRGGIVAGFFLCAVRCGWFFFKRNVV